MQLKQLQGDEEFERLFWKDKEYMQNNHKIEKKSSKLNALRNSANNRINFIQPQNAIKIETEAAVKAEKLKYMEQNQNLKNSFEHEKLNLK